MIHRTRIILTLLVFTSFGLLSTGINHSAYAGQANTKKAQLAAPGTISGKVTEIINTANYTYAEVESGNKKIWAAGPVTPLKTGDMITFSAGMPMENFRSKSMQRDFSIIYFTGRFITGKDGPHTAAPHAQFKKKQTPKEIKGINKVDGGNTIAEIYSQKTKLKGKTIRVRGQVIKFTPEIMGKNWLHIRDSSSLDDLTVTSNNKADIGDVVIIKGKLELDKDFNYGYVYPVIVEDATIEKE